MTEHPYTAYCKKCETKTSQKVLKSETIEKVLATYSDGIKRAVSNTRLDLECPCGFKDYQITDSYVFEIMPDGSKKTV